MKRACWLEIWKWKKQIKWRSRQALTPSNFLFTPGLQAVLLMLLSLMTQLSMNFFPFSIFFSFPFCPKIFSHNSIGVMKLWARKLIPSPPSFVACFSWRWFIALLLAGQAIKPLYIKKRLVITFFSTRAFNFFICFFFF